MLPFAAFAVAAAAPTTVRIEIDPSERKPAISRNLFGKFTEHLGRNVYQGMWAQIVVNPEFVPSSRWQNAENLNRRLEAASSQFGLAGLAESAQRGVAAFWLADGDVTCRHARDGVQDIQQVRVGPGDGRLSTGIWAPLHRVRMFDLTLVARASSATTAVVRVLRTTGETVAETTVDIDREWGSATARLTVAGDFEPGDPTVLAIELAGTATFELRRIVLFPTDHIEGWEPEVVAMMRDAKLPMLRFPGGNFVSGYHWEDGVGDLDARPSLANPAWHEVEFNHVGTDEWLRLCELVGCEPLICNNAGNGTPDEARRWVEYCNGSTETPMGSLRARNGHAEPYNVRYWEIGNELYGGWQIGHTNAEGYAERYLRFRDAMLAADPDILIVANGDTQAWNRTLVERAGSTVRSISVHSLPGSHIPADADPRAVFLEFMAHAEGYADYLHSLAKPMVDAGLEPVLAVTELQVFTNKPTLPNNASLTDALWTAGILHACIRSGIVELVTHSAMLNHGGGLRKERSIVYTTPVWWTTRLYGAQAGTVPLGVRVECDMFTNDGQWLGKRENVPYLDVMALADEEGDSYSLFVVNRHPVSAIRALVTVAGADVEPVVDVTRLTGDGYMATNRWNETQNVVVADTQASFEDGTLDHVFPPCSLTRLTLRVGSR
ncbi:hypothetical protein FJZ36_06710 [Candidatus Poribacteria bacterium]|nr:hypothetical protein [Candidatus Poribacteria bacterium]